MPKSLIAWIALAGAVLLQQFAGFPESNLFTRSLSNWAHIPTFFVITLCAGNILASQSLGRIGFVVLGIAILTEAAQVYGPRDASFADLGLNFLGMGAGIWGLKEVRAGRSTLRVWGVATALVVIVSSAAPAAVLYRYYYQHQIFPRLLDPADIQSWLLLDTSADVLRTLEHDWDAYSGERVLQVQWNETRWPGLHLAEPIGDWGGYKRLNVDVYNPADSATTLTTAVRHSGRSGTSRAQAHVVGPGVSTISTSVSDLQLTDGGEKAEISYLILHTRRSESSRILFFGRVWLE